MAPADLCSTVCDERMTIRPLTAVILAAGYGRRMRPLTDECHKTLLTIGGTTILGRILDGLSELGVDDILVVTGYREPDIRGFVAEHRASATVRFVHNDRYDSTNNIVSLALAFAELDFTRDLILIESDLIFDPSVLEALLIPGDDNLALVDRFRAGMGGTVVAVEDGLVSQVFPPHLQGRQFRYDDKFKTLNIYRFNRVFCRERFGPLLECYANFIDGNAYYELVLGMLVNMQRERIRAIEVQGDWAEVDDPNDLEMARYVFEPGNRVELLDHAAGGYWSFDVLDFHYLRNMHFPPDAVMAAMRDALPQVLLNYGSRQDVLDLCVRAQASRVPFAPLSTMRTLLESAHLDERQFFVELDHPVAGRLKYPGALAKFSACPWLAHDAAPTLGQHNRRVYCDLLKMSPSEVAELGRRHESLGIQ